MVELKKWNLKQSHCSRELVEQVTTSPLPVTCQMVESWKITVWATGKAGVILAGRKEDGSLGKDLRKKKSAHFDSRNTVKVLEKIILNCILKN